MKEKYSLITPILGIALFSFMVLFLLIGKKDVLFDKATDFYEMEESVGVKKDTYVELYVDGVVGNYAETKHYTNFIPTGTDQHYMLWLENEEIISLTVKDKDTIAKLDRICDDTWDYIESESEYYNVKGISIKGVIHSIDPEISGYYKQWLNETGISDAGLKVNYVEIDATETPGSQWILLIFAVVLLIGSIVMLINNIKKKKEIKEAEEYAAKLRAANEANNSYNYTFDNDDFNGMNQN